MKMKTKPIKRQLHPLISMLLLAATGMIGYHIGTTQARTKGITITSLLNSGRTVLGQPITYPSSGRAQIIANIVTIAPGTQTGWHTHDFPVIGYILEGELTVDYGSFGTRTFKSGTAVIEAYDRAHNGKNLGTKPAKILSIFLSNMDRPISRPLKAPKTKADKP